MPGAAILVVEDDEAIGRGLQQVLTSHGYCVAWVCSGAEAVAAAESKAPDLVLLDLGLPDIDGVEVCREIRSRRAAAVIVVLTARRDEVDVVVALEAGADDYLTKPFRLRELLARFRAHLRRSGGPDDPRELTAGQLTMQPSSHRVFVDGAEVDLRPKEFDLLLALMSRVDRVATRDQLMADVWDTQWYATTKTLDIHISSLRRKLADAGWHGRIDTLRGVGYRLERK